MHNIIFKKNKYIHIYVTVVHHTCIMHNFVSKNKNRTENQMDPNRDFPYRQDPAQCMLTIAVRAFHFYTYVCVLYM